MTKEIPTAWAVLDMDGEAFHSVHIFKDDAIRASIGLGNAVPVGPLADQTELLTQILPLLDHLRRETWTDHIGDEWTTTAAQKARTMAAEVRAKIQRNKAVAEGRGP